MPIDYRIAVHYRPLERNLNVRCLNGSAHLKETTDITKVTCELCLNPDTNKDFWNRARYKNCKL